MEKAIPSRGSINLGGSRDADRYNLGKLGPYLVKSVAVVAVLFILSRALPMMPIWAVALALAALSLIPATGSIYRVIVNRTFGQKKFGEGSIHKGRFLLRIPFFVGLYMLSAVSVASILMESPTWDVRIWVVVALAVPLYVVVAAAAIWYVGGKEKAIPLVRDARAARYSVVATGVLLCILLTVISFPSAGEAYICAADAFMEAPKPFEASPSVLMREAGDLMALVGGLRSYALIKLSETSWLTYVVLQVALNAAAMFGVAGMLSVCFVELRELKRVFLTLENDDGSNADRTVVKSFCVVFVVLPLLLTVGLSAFDAEVQDHTQHDEYTFAKKVIREQVSLIVYEIDGKYYDPVAVDEILAQAKEKSEAISREAEETLVPLINASFDARIANVDSYLDWYYGLFTDWEMLFRMVTGSAEEFAAKQLESRLEQNIDDSELNSKLEQYLKQAEDLQSATMSRLSEFELTKDYPDWLVSNVTPADVVLEQSFEPSRNFLKANERVGISFAAGALAGVIAKKVIKKIAAKTAFKAIASRVGGLATASGAASAGGPVAFAIAVIASFGMDIAMVKADELKNRESYKQELVDAIEEQRAEMLAAVAGIST